MKISHLAAHVALGAAALALAVPGVAHAEDGDRVKFSSPSGNIRCVIDAAEAPAAAMCQLENITFSVPAGGSHDDNGAPCPRDYGSGRDFRLVAGEPGFVRCSYAALDGGMGSWPTLEYGQSQTLGGITCASTPIAVTCTDTASQHFFRISRDIYEVG